MIKLNKYLFIVFSTFLISCSDILIHEFATSSEFFKSKVYQNGWITLKIPNSAYNIKIMNDLDTNKVWMCFSFKADDFSLKKRTVFNDKKLYTSILHTLRESSASDDIFYSLEDNSKLIISYNKSRLVYYKEFFARD